MMRYGVTLGDIKLHCELQLSFEYPPSKAEMGFNKK